MRLIHPALPAVLFALAAACAPRSVAAPGGPAEYAALPDTLVCVVDRAAPSGLRQIPAKQGPSGVVVLQDASVRTLEEVHPVNLIAGYAGREIWLTRGEPITVAGRRYIRTGGERRIAIELLRREDEFRGILVFAAAEDARPPDALYVPTAPGCIFQAFVREDMIRR